jgi:hypothetical protein
LPLAYLRMVKQMKYFWACLLGTYDGSMMTIVFDSQFDCISADNGRVGGCDQSSSSSMYAKNMSPSS